MSGLLAPSPPPLVVHEWGTFTTVVSPNGRPVTWRPLLGDQDLPSFVYERGPDEVLPDGTQVTKGGILALVRMETPVVYFYTDAKEAVPVELSVGYLDGWLTEWFPRADLVGHQQFARLRWQVSVLPRSATAPLADDGSDSHYYASRAVDANTVVDEATGEVDRLLFYRGVGNAAPTISLVEDDGGLLVTAASARGSGLVVTAEDASLCWQPVDIAAGISAPGSQRCGAQAELEAEIVALLVEQGLYGDEALAMVATWEGHWFEPGTRLMSIMPREETDTLLPMEITPAPASLERVMVERTELLPAAKLEALGEIAAAGGGRAEAEVLFGRFVDAAVIAAHSQRMLTLEMRQRLMALP